MERRRASVPRGLAHLTPVFIASGDGATLIDVDGNRLLDFAGGLGCLNVGHASAAVVEAIQRQSAQYLHACFHVTPNDGYVRLAEALNARVPGPAPKKTLLVNSGAEAVENAIKIARAYTGRPAILAFEDAFHGRTLLGMSLTSKTHPYKAGFGPFAPEIYRMPYASADRFDDTFRRVVAAESVAAVIVEPVLGEGGFVVPPPEFLPRLASICREHGMLLVADEIQTGFGRTGTLFACEQYGVEPDMLLAGKSLGSGLPIASVTGRAEVMDAAEEGGLGGTYGGNPLACEAALAVLQTFDRQRLGERARAIGRLIEARTEPWSERFEILGERRGIGAMRAFEFVRDRESKQPAREETAGIIAACHARGLIVIPAGTYGNVIRILVPLVATDAQLWEGVSVLETAIAEVASERS
jgi:4-aminobutyrate aminotransferase / (S)-3-amino-2-methylpropionate transaminase / 5-aminovalerate transaminase